MFETEYNVLGSALHGIVLPCRALITLEQDYYPVIKKASEQYNWIYNRVETRDKRGMPDILVTKAAQYWYIEVKRLKKKHLSSVEDDLHWQFGQLAFMKNCMRNRSRYILAVVKEHSVLLLKGAFENEYIDYPDFTEQL